MSETGALSEAGVRTFQAMVQQHRALGSRFTLVNDHDPEPLRYQLESRHTGEVIWEVLQAGPPVWRARIGRAPCGRCHSDLRPVPTQ